MNKLELNAQTHLYLFNQFTHPLKGRHSGVLHHLHQFLAALWHFETPFLHFLELGTNAEKGRQATVKIECTCCDKEFLTRYKMQTEEQEEDTFRSRA